MGSVLLSIQEGLIKDQKDEETFTKSIQGPKKEEQKLIEEVNKGKKEMTDLKKAKEYLDTHQSKPFGLGSLYHLRRQQKVADDIK